jgi:hypothetical protein
MNSTGNPCPECGWRFGEHRPGCPANDPTGIAVLFPGPPLEIPTDAERERADKLLAEWAARWGECYTSIARVHPPAIRVGLFASGLEGLPTNRAFMRAQLRRFFKHPTGAKA